MEFEIEYIEMPNRIAKKGQYLDILRKLGINDDSSVFVSIADHKDIFSLRSGIHATARRAGLGITCCYEFKLECENCGIYRAKKNRPTCAKCKLIDSGLRVWRIK